MMSLSRFLSVCLFSLVVACSGGAVQEQGVSFDFEAFDYDQTHKKAKSGDTEAQHLLGLSHLAKKETDQATQWLCKAARTGHGQSQYHIARLYAGYTVDVKPEVPVALFWAEQAKKNGQEQAQIILDEFGADLEPQKIRYLRSIRLSGRKYAPCLWNEVRSVW